METVLLDRRLVERIRSFSGETVEAKIIHFNREEMNGCPN